MFFLIERDGDNILDPFVQKFFFRPLKAITALWKGSDILKTLFGTCTGIASLPQTQISTSCIFVIRWCKPMLVGIYSFEI